MSDAESDSHKALQSMYRIRYFEEKVMELRKEQIHVVGSVHLSIGQEAIPVGARMALGPDDMVFATYRGHGWAIACGVPPELLFAELMGREGGVCKGRGGSAYFTAPDWGFYGENSIIAAGAPIACGAALAAAFQRKKSVAIVSVGEGAMNQGAIHEAMNFAAYKKLAVIFVCENNTYSELTLSRDMVKNDQLYQRAAGYGIPGVRIDGNDVAEVQRTIKSFAAAALAGDGPALVEAMTQRLVGHYYGDMQTYRAKGELAAAQASEPIVRLRGELEVSGVTAGELDTLASGIRNEIEAASQKAIQMSLADPATVKEHVYA